MSENNNEQGTILVLTADSTETRRRGPKELDVEILTENVNVFLNQMAAVMEEAPEDVGNFSLNKFVVSAEITAEGNIMLVGSGVKAGIKGGLNFEFERKSS